MDEAKRNLMQVSATKKESQKVASTVATFLNEDNTGSQLKREIGKVSKTKKASQKVASTVATFLNEVNSGGLFKRGISYIYHPLILENDKSDISKKPSQKVTSTVGTFSNKGCSFIWDFKNSRYHFIVIQFKKFNKFKMKIAI